MDLETREAKNIFETALKTTERPGMEELLCYLFERTDFLTAPASTRYHDCTKGGLVRHSVRVYRKLMGILQAPGTGITASQESAAIAGLLHDVCKTNMYKPCIKHRKVDDGNGRSHWEDYEGYEISDAFPAGHGEKSVMIIERFIQLTAPEIMAINWHMGGFDIRARSYEGGNQLSTSMEKYPLIIALHAADLMATYEAGARA